LRNGRRAGARDLATRIRPVAAAALRRGCGDMKHCERRDGIRAAPSDAMTTRRMCLMTVAVLGGCLCPGERVTGSAYASMASFRSQITACIVEHECERLCADVLGFGDGAEIESCVITAVDRAPATLAVASAADDLSLVIGVSLRITYVMQEACSVDWADDDWTDDGSTDDGSTDDGGECDDWCDDEWDDDEWDDDDWDDDDWGDDDGGDDDPGDDGG
jgi:hypothetical protein